MVLRNIELGFGTKAVKDYVNEKAQNIEGSRQGTKWKCN
jgi:hypothetical protein